MLVSKSELLCCASEYKKGAKSIYAFLGLCCVGILWRFLALETDRARYYEIGFDIHFSGLSFQIKSCKSSFPFQ